MSRLCPMCGVNPTPPLTYGETESRQYICDDCVIEGHRRAAEMRPEIDRLRRSREASDERWRVEQADRAAVRQRHQTEITEVIRRQWPDRL